MASPNPQNSADWEDFDDAANNALQSDLADDASENAQFGEGFSEEGTPSEPSGEGSVDEAAVDAALTAVADDPSVPHDYPFRRAAAKVREFPRTPGIYLMKDDAGRVIYVGKAKNLRSRAGSYFLQGAQNEYRTASWVHEIADVDYVECESEVDALLMESRLIKDVQP